MKRLFASCIAVASVALVAPSLSADVKTREKTVVRFEGFVGRLMNRAFGGNDGITSTVAVKGNRLARTADNQVEIIDLSEQRVYSVDTRRREYTVRTFEEIRKQMEQARAELEKQSQEMSADDRQAMQQAGKNIDFDVDVRETGQRRNLAGHDAREVVVTIAMRERGRTLEESGGLVMTNTMWLGPTVAALAELHAFQMKYFQAVFGADFAGMNVQSMNALSAMVPGIGTLASRMAQEQRRLEGTPLSTTMVFESVRSPEQMKQAEAGQQSGGGGGIGGAIAGRLMRRNAPQQRSTAMTTTNDILSIDPTVTDAELAIPANFKQR